MLTLIFRKKTVILQLIDMVIF